MSIHERIKHRRIELGLTQQELAYMIGANDYKIIWRYENDKTKPTFDNLLRLCESLKITPDWLLGYENSLEEDEKELLELYRSKNPEIRERLLMVARAF